MTDRAHATRPKTSAPRSTNTESAPGARVTALRRAATEMGSPQVTGPTGRPMRYEPSLKNDGTTLIVSVRRVRTHDSYRFTEMRLENLMGTAYKMIPWDGTVPKWVTEPLRSELENEAQILRKREAVSDSTLPGDPGYVAAALAWEDLLMSRQKSGLPNERGKAFGKLAVRRLRPQWAIQARRKSLLAARRRRGDGEMGFLAEAAMGVAQTHVHKMSV